MKEDKNIKKINSLKHEIELINQELKKQNAQISQLQTEIDTMKATGKKRTSTEYFDRIPYTTATTVKTPRGGSFTQYNTKTSKPGTSLGECKKLLKIMKKEYNKIISNLQKKENKLAKLTTPES